MTRAQLDYLGAIKTLLPERQFASGMGVMTEWLAVEEVGACWGRGGGVRGCQPCAFAGGQARLRLWLARLAVLLVMRVPQAGAAAAPHASAPADAKTK